MDHFGHLHAPCQYAHEELCAHVRWGTSLLPPNMHVKSPVPMRGGAPPCSLPTCTCVPIQGRAPPWFCQHAHEEPCAHARRGTSLLLPTCTWRALCPCEAGHLHAPANMHMKSPVPMRGGAPPCSLPTCSWRAVCPCNVGHLHAPTNMHVKSSVPMQGLSRHMYVPVCTGRRLEDYSQRLNLN